MSIYSTKPFLDARCVCAHQHASGARRNEERTIGKSYAGSKTKIQIAADVHGNPIDFEITGCNVRNANVADTLIKKIGTANNFLVEKGYDAETICEQAKNLG